MVPLLSLLSLSLSLFLLRLSLTEELLLLIASTLFFSTLFFRLRELAAGWAVERAEEVYTVFGQLLELRLLRLGAVVGLGRRLVGGVVVVDRLLPPLLLLFSPLPLPPLPIGNSVHREAAGLVAQLLRSRRSRQLVELERQLSHLSSTIEERFLLARNVP